MAQAITPAIALAMATPMALPIADPMAPPMANAWQNTCPVPVPRTKGSLLPLLSLLPSIRSELRAKRSIARLEEGRTSA